MIHEQLIVQWFTLGLIQKIIDPLRMHEIPTYEYALNKYQQFESNGVYYTSMIHHRTKDTQRLEEKLEMMQWAISDISMRNENLWCTIYMTKGYTKDTCWNKENRT